MRGGSKGAVELVWAPSRTQSARACGGGVEAGGELGKREVELLMERRRQRALAREAHRKRLAEAAALVSPVTGRKLGLGPASVTAKRKEILERVEQVL